MIRQESKASKKDANFKTNYYRTLFSFANDSDGDYDDDDGDVYIGLHRKFLMDNKNACELVFGM